jgi:hypothetical protein
MLPRDLELLRKIGLTHFLAKSYGPQHLSECEQAAGQFLEKLFSIDRAVGIPLDFPLPLSSQTKFFLRAPAQSDSAYHHCTLAWGTRKHARLVSPGMRLNQASHVPAFVGLNSTT